MDVIRHHHPRAQIVTLTVEKTHRVFDKLGNNVRLAQITISPSTVEIRLQFRATLLVIFDFQELFPF